MNNASNVIDIDRITNFHYKVALTIDEKVMHTVKYQPVNEQTLKNIEFSDVEISPFILMKYLAIPKQKEYLLGESIALLDSRNKR